MTLRQSWTLDRAALAILALAVLWQVLPLFTPPFATHAIVGTDTYRSHDWLEVAKFDHYAREAILRWRRLPLWNPLLAGGQPQFAHPSDGSMSPLILPSLALGETLGMKVNIGLVALIGTLGLFVLLRRVLSCGTGGAFVAALGYAWSGWLPARVAVGFYESCLVVAWPALLALWLMPGPRRARRRRWSVAAVLLWALAVQLQLALPVLVVLMAILWTATAIQARLQGQALPLATGGGAIVILALAGLLGGVKFVPMLNFLSEADFRQTTLYPLHPDAWYFSFDQLWYALFHHVPGLPIVDRDGSPRIQEYMTLQPALGVLLLAGVGLLQALRPSHRAWPWLVVSFVFLWLSFGPHAPVDGFRALRQLPLFASMRGPLRYFNYPVLLGICMVAAVGFDLVEEKLTQGIDQWLSPGLRSAISPNRAVAALVLVAAGLCLPVSLDSRDLYRTSFLYSAGELEAPTEIRSEGLRREMAVNNVVNLRKYVNIVRGVPTIYVPEDIPLRTAAIPAVWIGAAGQEQPEPEYRGEAWVTTENHLAGDERPVPGRARVLALRPQEVVVSHDLDEPAIVVINQNRWPGWSCGDRKMADAISAEFGLVAFFGPEGAGGQTTCTWSPPGLGPGLMLSFLGLVGLGLLAAGPWDRSKQRTTPTADQAQ